ncbi:MAG: SH3 domain-containing protein [Lachnospiraceae bacterium]|nr:SH3 domain-containing protein [Lachnospiraceae bacterium]
MKKSLMIFLAMILLGSVLSGCGKKEEEVIVTTIDEDFGPGAKENVTMEVARDDDLRKMLFAFDLFTNDGRAGSMEFDSREEISGRRLMDCMFGQKCCVDYTLYPVPQVVDTGTSMSVPAESVSWVATHIFHVPQNIVADYQRTSANFSDGNYSGAITLDENGVRWYYSDFTIIRAETDGEYYYIKYRRNHDDPRIEGTAYQQIYFAVMAKEMVENKEYWTLYTHSADAFIPVVKDPNLEPDEILNEVEMVTVGDSNVVVRSGPSREYDRVTVLAPGILVYALGKKGDWYYIRYYDHYGWIYYELLEKR